MFELSLKDLIQIPARAFRSDIAMALGLIVLLSILIFPLPPIFLDLGLSLSITLSILVLMVAVFLIRPLDFTSFPTLLLLITLFRLSLNVATTRLILSHGSEGAGAAGQVVAAFGGFLMGGDVVIGIILFAILLIVNFVVITKGSGRIAEVAARFSLDAMPGKQMAIDSDMSAGLIDEKTARRRRKELEDESGFYGAMDGAAKFVRGDAIAGLMITIVNVLGGLAIGVLREGVPIQEAFHNYTTLTVGDGLVSQIPALLVSTAAGIVVTKGGLEGTADAALVRQLGGSPKPLAIAAGSAAVLALLPGLPMLPFMAIAGLAGGGAWLRFKADKQTSAPAPSLPSQQPEPKIADILRMDLMRLELGYGLLSLASGDTPRLTEQIKRVRNAIAAEFGFVLPPVRIQDNMQLPPDRYVLKVRELDAGSGELRAGMMLVMDPGGGTVDLPGIAVSEPAFGLPALWIDPAMREQAVFRGCTVVDPASVLATHLTEISKQMMPELLGFAETQKLIDDLDPEHRKLVTDLIPSHITIAGIQRVLQMLLAERVSIRDLPTIFESIMEICMAGPQSIPAIIAHVRVRLARQISESHVGPQGFIPLITLAPEWEYAFSEAITGPADDRQLAIAPSKLSDFISRLRTTFDAATAAGEAPVLLTGHNIRVPIRAIVERFRPSIAVLSQKEIFARAKIRNVGTIAAAPSVAVAGMAE
jgi:flagellar biosynthesis protein FlhA